MNFNDFMWLRLEAVIINFMCTCQIYVYEKALDQRIISLQEQKLMVPAATQHHSELCSLNYSVAANPSPVVPNP